MSKDNKNRLFEMMNKVNKITLNESYYSNTNKLGIDSDVFKNIYTGVNNLREVGNENVIGNYILSFNGMEIIDTTGYNNTGVNSSIVIGFNEIEVVDNTNNESYVFDQNAENTLIKYINDNDKWMQSIYEQAEEYLTGKQDNNYMNEDIIKGGLGDDKNLDDFDPEQVKRGLDVEKEHTDNPEIAGEITADHLTEVPNYYGDEGSDPECCAQCNAASDVENPDKDMGSPAEFSGKLDTSDPLVDVLLGYKPLNVGDYVKQQ